MNTQSLRTCARWTSVTVFWVTLFGFAVDSSSQVERAPRRANKSLQSETAKSDAPDLVDAAENSGRFELRWLSRKGVTRHQDIIYHADESEQAQKKGQTFQLVCDVYQPDQAGPHPAVICVHGGGWAWGSKLQMVRHGWKFSSSGYVAIAINYRHAPKWKFPAQIHDVKAAVRWARKNAETYDIDPDRIVAFGYSAGGNLVSLLGSTDPDDGLEGSVLAEDAEISTRVAAVAAGGAPCGLAWFDDDSRALNYWLGGPRGKKPEAWRNAAPVNFVTADDPPFWFFHAQNDTVVPVSESLSMHEALKKAGVKTEHTTYPRHVHLTLFGDLRTANQAIEFFDDALGVAKAPETDR